MAIQRLKVSYWLSITRNSFFLQIFNSLYLLNDKIFVDYNFYESLLILNSNYDQIQLLIMYMVERILKIKVYKLMKLLVKPDGIESSYKLKNESNTKA